MKMGKDKKWQCYHPISSPVAALIPMKTSENLFSISHNVSHLAFRESKQITVFALFQICVGIQVHHYYSPIICTILST